MSNFKTCLKETLSHEGGWADHPRDPGGATMKGITLNTYSQFKFRKMTKEELRNISDAEVEQIYRKLYWDKVSADQLPPGVDLAVFDAAVNSGPSRSAKWLQEVVGVKADGKIGPVTLEAVKAVPPKDLINRLIEKRLGFLRRLDNWEVFGRGWERRVRSVWAVAIAMQSAHVPARGDDQPAPATSTGPGWLTALLRKIFGG